MGIGSITSSLAIPWAPSSPQNSPWSRGQLGWLEHGADNTKIVSFFMGHSLKELDLMIPVDPFQFRIFCDFLRPLHALSSQHSLSSRHPLSPAQIWPRRWRSAGGEAGPGRKGRAPAAVVSVLGSRCSVPGLRCLVPGARRSAGPAAGRAGSGRVGPGGGSAAGWGRAGGTLPSGRSLALSAASLPSAWPEALLSVNKCLCWIRRDFRCEGFEAIVNTGSCGGVRPHSFPSWGGAFTLLNVLLPHRSFAHFAVRTSLLSLCCANLRINWIKYAHFSNYLSPELLHVPVPSGSDPGGPCISHLCVLALRLDWIHGILCSYLASTD